MTAVTGTPATGDAQSVLVPRRRPGPVARRALTGAAFVLLWAALVVPGEPAGLTPGTLLQVPVEAPVLVAVALLLPTRLRRWWAALAGGVIGLSVALRIADIASLGAVDRRFDVLSDWTALGPAVDVLGDGIGRPQAVAAAVLLAAVLVCLPVAVATAALRVTRTTARHRTRAVRGVLALGLVAVLGAVGAAVGGPRLTSATAVGGLATTTVDVRDALREREAFARQLAAPDPAADLPARRLLEGLRGKDVLLVFVESYGRVAVQGSTVSAQVAADLDAGTGALRTAGFSARSAFLTSPTSGGVSALAHSTLQSGLWVDGRRTYDQLLSSDRATLTSLFARAGWRTVADIPSSPMPWREGQRFYRYEAMYGTGDVGYAGPVFGYAKIPDQYTLEAFRRRELTPGSRRPVMAEIDLVSSHTPWAPLPRLVPWTALGDGAVYRPMPAQGQDAQQVWGDPEQVRAAYGASIRYSLAALVSFVRTYGDDDLVLVVLGDHQPAPVVTGPGASRDVPVSVIARDPRVLDRIASWGWQDGLRPPPDAPVWRMDTFRDRFLSAYAAPQ